MNGGTRIPSRAPERDLAELPQALLSFRVRSASFAREFSRMLPGATEDREEIAPVNLRVTRAVFGKWSIDILVALFALGVAGFQELRRHLSGVSPRVLSTKLKVLERLGLISRTVLHERPPRVQYRLTEAGLNVAHLGEPVILYLRYLASLRPE